MRDRWTFSSRFIAHQIKRASVRTTLTYRLVPTLTAGVEYNPRAGKVSTIANWLAIPESKNIPALILGTSSDRISTPSGPSFYATASRDCKLEATPPTAPFFCNVYGAYDSRFGSFAWLNVRFTVEFRSRVMF